MGKPLDSPASFRPISLTSCVSKLFERIILSRLLFLLESNSILSLRQAGFRSRRSTLNQILFLSQSILEGFNKPRPGFRTILSTIDFSKAFDSVWHPALFHKPISAGLPPCYARWTQSFFLIGALVWFIKITKVVPFESVEVFRKDPFLALYFSLSSLMIFRPLCLLPSATFFMLTIWPFGPPLPRSLLRWRLSFSQRIPTRLTSSPTFSYSAPASVLIPLQLFLGSPSTALFFFSKHVSSLKASFSHVSRPYTVSLLPHGAPLRSPSLFCINLFLGSFSLTLHPDGFLS